MADLPMHPTVYEINTWAWLTELRASVAHPVTLADVPEPALTKLADRGFDAVWLMGVWCRSPASARVARQHAGLQAEFREALPDYTADDVVGSPYAVYDYRVAPELGGDEALAALRVRLADVGIRLILDFVPNHLAVDHPWVAEHPEVMLRGSADEARQQPGNYFQEGHTGCGPVFAHGRDPLFDGWTDTVQLDYRKPDTRLAMTRVLQSIAAKCDGVRCDMAMLVLSDILRRTWGGEVIPAGAEFWSEAIPQVRAQAPGFLFLAEAYWGTEWILQQLGFDYVYDKSLYDCLRAGEITAARDHLRADLRVQSRLARFIENHDEQRAVQAFGTERSRAAAVIALTLPGLRLFHEGQLAGQRFRTPVQLGRRRSERPDPELLPFYEGLLSALQDPVFKLGSWRTLEPAEAWSGNASHRGYMAHCWQTGTAYRLCVANLSPDRGQSYLRLDDAGLVGCSWRLVDLLGSAEYVRDGDRLAGEGLYLDMPGFGYHLFDFQRA